MKLPFIPPHTQAELQTPAPEGYRHDQIKNLALQLLGAGLREEAVFAQLRPMYDQGVSDSEIRDLITWAASKNPKPCGYAGQVQRYDARPLPRPGRVSSEVATANAEKWLGEFRCDGCDLWHVSPWRPLEDCRFDGLMLCAALYRKEEHINVISDFTIEQKEVGQKANPKGAGKTMLRDAWMRYIRDQGPPGGSAGAWIRPNPVKPYGSGKDGAITDIDVTSHRFCLLESDSLPLDLQLSLWARIPLPIAAIIESGGRSVHAWVAVNCANPEEYRTKVDRIYSLLARFGICSSNKNSSRLSRFPGAQREIGKHGDGMQRLLYLNDEPSEAPIFERSK